MKSGKTWLKITGAWLLAVISVLPLGALWRNQTQTAEQRKTITPILHERAKPTATRVMLQNVIESVRIKGTFVPGEGAYQELDPKEARDIRWIVQAGEQILSGQVLGYYKGKALRAEYTGILKELDTYSDRPYLYYTVIEEPHLQCFVTPEQARKLREAPQIYTETLGLQLLSVSDIRRSDGTVKVLFAVPGSVRTVGDTLELTVYTGVELKYQMVLPVSCIYQKTEGEDQPWYVYQVTQQGEPVGEIEVELGYTDGQIVCINQLEMATYYRRIR